MFSLFVKFDNTLLVFLKITLKICLKKNNLRNNLLYSAIFIGSYLLRIKTSSKLNFNFKAMKISDHYPVKVQFEFDYKKPIIG